MKTYILKPTMTFKRLSPSTDPLKSADLGNRDPQAEAITQSIVPAAPTPMVTVVPPPQPLPKPLIDPHKPIVKLGLDVHLLFLRVVVQKGHAAPLPPRKSFPVQLCSQIQRWVQEGFQVFCVQER